MIEWRRGRPLVLAYAGPGLGAWSDTLAGAARALARGADGVALPIRVTADGVAVLSHAGEIGGLPVRGTAFAPLQQARGRRAAARLSPLDHALTTLADALAWLRGIPTLLRLLDPDAAEAVSQALRAAGSPGWVLVTSPFPNVADAVARAAGVGAVLPEGSGTRGEHRAGTIVEPAELEPGGPSGALDGRLLLVVDGVTTREQLERARGADAIVTPRFRPWLVPGGEGKDWGGGDGGD